MNCQINLWDFRESSVSELQMNLWDFRESSVSELLNKFMRFSLQGKECMLRVFAILDFENI